MEVYVTDGIVKDWERRQYSVGGAERLNYPDGKKKINWSSIPQPKKVSFSWNKSYESKTFHKLYRTICILG